MKAVAVHNCIRKTGSDGSAGERRFESGFGGGECPKPSDKPAEKSPEKPIAADPATKAAKPAADDAFDPFGAAPATAGKTDGSLSPRHERRSRRPDAAKPANAHLERSICPGTNRAGCERQQIEPCTRGIRAAGVCRAILGLWSNKRWQSAVATKPGIAAAGFRKFRCVCPLTIVVAPESAQLGF